MNTNMTERNTNTPAPTVTPTPDPYGVMELTEHGFGLSDVIDVMEYVNTNATTIDGEPDTDRKSRVGRIANRIRTRGRARDAVGTIDGEPSYAYRVFGDTWVIPSRTTMYPNVSADTITAGGGASRSDGRRKMVAYANTNDGELVRFITTITTITNGAPNVIRWANDTRGTVWLTVADGVVVEHVTPNDPTA